MTAEAYVELREGRGATVRRVQDGWQVTCPAHEDRTPSLSVTAGRDGRVLLHCHAGCSKADIVAADGLELADLFERRNGRVEVAAYDYVDEQGELLFQCVRFYPKHFSQRRPRRSDTCGCEKCRKRKDPDWIWNLHKTRYVLYRLPKVIEAVQAGATIYVVDGEKDVRALERAGEVATCGPMGAGNWRPEYAEPLRGANVILVADRREDGYEDVRRVAASLEGVAASVAMVAAAEGKDAADHLAAGKTVDEFVPVDRAADSTEEEPAASNLGEIPAYPVQALPEAAQKLVRYGERQGLPAALVAGAALGALAAAIGRAVNIEVSPSWHERATLWVPLLAPRGAGKSPSLTLAFTPLRERDEELGDDEDEKAILLGDLTMEALARSLNAVQGAAALDLDELAVLLRGLGEYKRGGGGDRGRFLTLWTGAPWRFARVGGKGGRKNNVNLSISRPTLVVCGGLQPALHELLGGEEDGLRPRWLPHLATMPSPAINGRRAVENLNAVAGWKELIHRLLDNRDGAATRTLSEAARAAFRHWQAVWKDRAAHRSETASTSAALIKADIHLARIALVLYEADPERPEQVEQDHIDRAAHIVNFTLDCWRALPEQDSMSLTLRDKVLDRGIVRLVGWLEEHGGSASRRELQMARVAGARTAADLDALLDRYEAVYPGTRSTVTPVGGGKLATVIRLPMRGRK